VSVDLLRRAAANIREDAKACGDGPTDLLPAIADWLDLSASDVWAWGPMCECGTGCDACDDAEWETHARQALTVARAYLGEEG
jgi:hypothetical protein